MTLTKEKLSADTGASVIAYTTLGVTPNCTVYVRPERDDHGNVIGYSTRDANGRTKSRAGLKRGMTMAWPMDPNAGASLETPLVVGEGMTDTAVGIDLGLSMIGRPSATGGAKYLVPLRRGKHVVIVAENDSGPGKAGAEKIAAAVRGVAASVRIIFPPECAKDLREWFNSPAPVTRAELLRLIELLDFLLEFFDRRVKLSDLGRLRGRCGLLQEVHAQHIDFAAASPRASLQCLRLNRLRQIGELKIVNAGIEREGSRARDRRAAAIERDRADVRVRGHGDGLFDGRRSVVGLRKERRRCDQHSDT